ncbi:hypothetical protein ACSNOI_12305 [Actinomadura kijaniata]|uniref:hypothetical protein n=1 Tax=Actinomadura kijaniata TaxID=46161 RepID=UPI003F1E09E9
MCRRDTALQMMVTRSFDPVVLTVGTFHLGTGDNVIPGEARFTGAVRGVAAAHGQGVEVEAAFVGDAVREVDGEGRFRAASRPLPALEGFSYVCDEVPSAFGEGVLPGGAVLYGEFAACRPVAG